MNLFCDIKSIIIFQGSLEITDLLLECNADINAVDCHGRTPLILAAYRGDTQVQLRN